MFYNVILTDGAVVDLEEIIQYIDLHSVDGRADHVLTEMEKMFTSLSELPERGKHPKELLALGNRDFREIHFKPYRIIYRVIGSKFYVFLIADSRRDMQALLQRRLLQC